MEKEKNLYLLKINKYIFFYKILIQIKNKINN